MKVTIAKALNLKNRLVGEKERLFRTVSASNSRLETQKVNYEAKVELEKYEKIVEALVAVKSAIATANAPVYGKIYRIAELKSKAAQLRQINTNEQDHEETKYNRQTGEEETVKTVKRVVYLKDTDIDAKVRDIEKEIEKLHDELTAFNHTTQIEVPEISL
jgi:dynactin complex subunit